MILMSIWVNTMNLRRQANIDKYLYEIIDEYKHTDSKREKNDIFKLFCSSLWSSDNKIRIYTKTIRFTVRKDLLKTDIGQIFDTWSEVEYKGYKSMSKETDWCSLIRQKINNLYTRYFDKEVILNKDYMYLLNTPKRLYYQWLDGIEMDPDELTIIIDDSIDASEKLKAQYQKQKMKLSWTDYKKVIEGFLQRIIDNCKLIEDYEDKTKIRNIFDFINEDNFYIKYFCKSLECEMLKWQKQYYGVRDHKKYKRCIECGGLFECKTSNQHRCVNCQKVHTRKNKTEKQRKYRVEKLKN